MTPFTFLLIVVSIVVGNLATDAVRQIITMIPKTLLSKLSAPVTLPFWTWLLMMMALLLNVANNVDSIVRSFTSARLESQVRQWSKEYPSDLRNRWAWCYLDSAENWSTDQKLREDVRLKSTQVLSADERETLTPLDKQISAEIPKQKTPLKETYTEVGNGLKTAEWHPPPAEPPPTPPKPEPPQRRRLFRGVQSP